MTVLNNFGIPDDLPLPDQTEAKAGGADYVPPEKGLARMRFVGYIETGVHAETFQGKPKEVPKVTLLFELSGKKHAPREIDGKKIPHIIKCDLSLSLTDKAHFFKIFCAMNAGKVHRHIAQMLGQSFLGTIGHDVVPKKGGKAGETSTFATLRKADGSYSIEPPFRVDPETYEQQHYPAAEPISPIRCFIWDHANKAQWDSIFIDGEHNGKSFNTYQNAIRGALNFEGSPIQEVLMHQAGSNQAKPDAPEGNISNDDEDDLDGI